MLCFLETPVLSSPLLPYLWWVIVANLNLNLHRNHIYIMTLHLNFKLKSRTKSILKITSNAQNPLFDFELYYELFSDKINGFQ